MGPIVHTKGWSGSRLWEPKLFWGASGGLRPGLKAMSAPRRRRFGLSVNLSRNP